MTIFGNIFVIDGLLLITVSRVVNKIRFNVQEKVVGSIGL